VRFSINATSLPSASQKAACPHVVPPRKAAALAPSAVTLQGLPGHGRPLVHHAAAQRRQPLPSFRLRMSDNVQRFTNLGADRQGGVEVPPPVPGYHCHGLRWPARARAPCVIPSLLSAVAAALGSLKAGSARPSARCSSRKPNRRIPFAAPAPSTSTTALASTDTNPDRIENVRERGLLHRSRAPQSCSALSRSDGADAGGAVLHAQRPGY